MASSRGSQIALQGVRNAVNGALIRAAASPAPVARATLPSNLSRGSAPRAWRLLQQHDHAPICRRCFSQTATTLSKKKGKAHKGGGGGGEHAAEPARETKSTDPKSPKPSAEDAFDLADVEAAYRRIDEHHEDKLKKLRVGGRFNPDVVGALRVRPDRHAAETYPLRELAQVAHKGGRNVSILVNEAEYIKPIMSAVQASPDFNQQPQLSPDNELELLIKIVPENPDEQARRVKEVCHAWREQIRDQLRRRSKEHAKWAGAKLVTADDVRRLDKEVKKLQDQQMTAIDAKEKKALQEVTSKQNRL